MLKRKALIESLVSPLINKSQYSFGHKIPAWANVDPDGLSHKQVHIQQNLVQGKWKDTAKYSEIVDPMNGDLMIKCPDANKQEADEFITSAKQCPKHGLHNPFKNPERYVMWGDLCFKIAQEMRKPEVEYFFSRLTQRVFILN